MALAVFSSDSASATKSQAYMVAMLEGAGLKDLVDPILAKGWLNLTTLCHAGGWWPGCGAAAEDAITNTYRKELADHLTIDKLPAFRAVYTAGHELLKAERKRSGPQFRDERTPGDEGASTVKGAG